MKFIVSAMKPVRDTACSNMRCISTVSSLGVEVAAGKR